MRLQKLLMTNLVVNWVFMFLMSAIVGLAYVMNGFPWPGVAVTVTVCGMAWSVFGLALCLVTLYFAFKHKLMKVWGCSAAMSISAFYVFMTIAASY